MTAIYYLTLVFFLFISLLLCVSVLLQESKSMGLGASMGGDAGESLFGTATADVLKKFTAWLAIVFVVFCLVLSLWTAKLGRSSFPVEETFIEQGR